MAIGKIMTFAVRQALAESAQAERERIDGERAVDPPVIQDGDDLPEGTLIPCATSTSASSALVKVNGGSEHVNDDKGKKRKREARDQVQIADEQITWTEKTIPEDLRKYWNQRHRLFSLFDYGVQLDRQSWYSVTPERIAQQIAERCRCDVVVDAFCGAGGNAIQFAMTCAKVIAIDIDPVKIQIAKHNAELYEVDDTIEFVCGDFVEWARKQSRGSADVVFLSPPWGGIDYLSMNRHPDGIAAPSNSTGMYPLSCLAPLPGSDLFALARSITTDVAIFLPRNLDAHEVGALAAAEEVVELEEHWMGRKCKAVTAYFGGLVGEGEEEDAE